jgi:hypothetical protein
MKRKKQKEKGRSIQPDLEIAYEENKHLIRQALSRGNFTSVDDQEEWYSFVCLAKVLSPELNDTDLMPENLMKMMYPAGTDQSTDQFDYILNE